jgi:FkbM family methyltransferase
MIITIIKKIVFMLKNFLKRLEYFIGWDPWVNLSWSQEGEDMLLHRILKKKTGFYVDVGAHHPKRFSNTYFFYRMGWSGINIDAMPGSMKEFEKCRKRDINLELGVYHKKDILDYYFFNEPALNSFSAKHSEELSLAEKNYNVKKILKIKVRPLREILAYHLKGRKIDFLNVDVEGFDLNVLQSNDWSKYRPRFVLAEILKSSLNNIEDNNVVRFMKKQGYIIYAKQMNTVFFEDLHINH